jgi:lantibiotic leader peptide-processing serine protease
MKIPRILLVGASAAAMAAAAACDVARPVAPAPDDAAAAAVMHDGSGRFLVEYSGRIDRVVAAVQAAGGQVGRTHESIEVLEVTGLSAQALKKLPGVQHATADLAVKMASYPIETLDDIFGAYELDPASPPNSDPTAAYFFPCQWNLQQIRAPGAWAAGARGAGVRIALIDTGLQHDHIDLAGKVDLDRSANFTTLDAMATLDPMECPADDRDPTSVSDYCGHGTWVASLATSNNIGVAGVAPDATIVAIKVLACNGWGSFLDVLAGILYAADLDVDVISLSLAGDAPRNELGRFVAVYQKAVNYATRQGKLVIGTAGNDAIDLGRLKSEIRIPTMLANVYSAYATDHLDRLAAYSAYGSSATWVGAPGGLMAHYDVPALPGCAAALPLQNRVPMACSGQSVLEPLKSWCRGGSTSTYLFGVDGTSFATPTVAGVAALVGGTRSGGFNPHQVATILAQTADDLGAPGVDNFYSHGRVNAARAVQRR